MTLRFALKMTALTASLTLLITEVACTSSQGGGSSGTAATAGANSVTTLSVDVNFKKQDVQILASTLPAYAHKPGDYTVQLVGKNTLLTNFGSIPVTGMLNLSCYEDCSVTGFTADAPVSLKFSTPNDGTTTLVLNQATYHDYCATNETICFDNFDLELAGLVDPKSSLSLNNKSFPLEGKFTLRDSTPIGSSTGQATRSDYGSLTFTLQNDSVLSSQNIPFVVSAHSAVQLTKGASTADAGGLKFASIETNCLNGKVNLGGQAPGGLSARPGTYEFASCIPTSSVPLSQAFELDYGFNQQYALNVSQVDGVRTCPQIENYTSTYFDAHVQDQAVNFLGIDIAIDNSKPVTLIFSTNWLTVGPTGFYVPNQQIKLNYSEPAASVTMNIFSQILNYDTYDLTVITQYTPNARIQSSRINPGGNVYTWSQLDSASVAKSKKYCIVTFEQMNSPDPVITKFGIIGALGTLDADEANQACSDDLATLEAMLRDGITNPEGYRTGSSCKFKDP